MNKNTILERCRDQKIKMEFAVALKCSSNQKLAFAMSGLSKEDWDFQRAVDKLREQINLAKQKNKS